MSPLLPLVILLLSCSGTTSQRVGPRGLSINCGATSGSEIDGIFWLPDSAFIREGALKTLSIPNLHPVLSVLRTFPFRQSEGPRQFCYSVNAIAGTKYLVRTTFFYGGVNGKRDPPVFDLLVDGTLWTVVNTTADYARNLSSYYEGIYKARRRRIRLCLGGNSYTDSDPFISSIEMIILKESLYNSTDFGRYAMGLVSRSSFGHRGQLFRYPNDTFNRYWQPFLGGTQIIKSSSNVSNLDLWNLPPQSIFDSALVGNVIEPMNFQWPQFSLPNSSYYIALYFADSSPESSRALDVTINGIPFSSNLRLSSSGMCVFASKWVLYGSTVITVAPSSGSNLPPLINGGEVFSLVELGGLTLSRDVFALEDIKRSLVNPPSNWAGDPCLPVEFRWTGVTCGGESTVRVVKLNLSNMSLSGSLSPQISQMTALTEIDLRNNNLSGGIPDLSRLSNLNKLHLQGNSFSGSLPPSLGELADLRELYLHDNHFSGSLPSSLGYLAFLNKLHLQNNNFTGAIPQSIGDLSDLSELFVENNGFSGQIPSNLRRRGLNFRYLPGNNLSP